MRDIDKIRSIKKGRIDLTDYLIHFTRIQDGKSSFEILKQIARDGFLKSGWSERSMRRTVFGTKPAVCFTESPLYGFVDYVKKRNDRTSIDSYGVAVLKEEFFRVGGRSLIYGSTLYRSCTVDPITNVHLIPDYPEDEQYRYLLTAINDKNDWTHEREWRWADWCYPVKNIQGLPLWRIDVPSMYTSTDSNYHFAPIVLIVRYPKEKDELISILAPLREEAQVQYKTAVKGWNDDDPNTIPPTWSIRALDSAHIIVLSEIDFLAEPYYTIEKAFNDGKVHKVTSHSW
jgi:hypothetical protein